MMTRVAESFRNIDGPRIKRFCANNAAFLAFVVLVIVAIILRGDVFLSSTNILNILRHNAIIGIIALGMTVVIILGDISLSVGSQLALVGWIAIDIFNRTNNVFLAILACALASIVAGLFEGVLTAKFKIPSIIVTLGTMTIYRSIVLFALSGGGLMAGVPPGGAGADRDRAAAAVYQSISNTDFLGLPLPIFYWIILSILLHIFLTHTATGRHIYATGSNEKAAMLSGVKVDRIRILGFVICGLMVALAAVVETSRVGAISSAAQGVTHNMDAIAAVVIGGTSLTGGKGRVIGTFFGVMTLGVITNMLNLIGVNPFFFGMATGGIIIGAVLLQKRLDKGK